ncbi:MAG: glucosaminidase domain-containing protein [Bacteroidales bacterium]
MIYYIARVRLLFFFIVLIIGGSSCSPKQSVTKQKKAFSGLDYIENYKDLAIREMRRTGIPASITLAQGMLESDYGNSRLARQANNHFGIKCHNNWQGRSIYHDDDKRNECFRKYDNPYESYHDHSEFLTSSQRYKFLFNYKETDYESWAHGLKQAGYATSPVYANKLIELIERYELYKYDNHTEVYADESKNEDSLGNVDNFSLSSPGHKVYNKNRIDYIIVKRGDTFHSLNEELDLLSWELRKYNELDNDYKLTPGEILYLQPKRNKAARGYDVHIVKEGDTMHSISQMYGIKLKKLYQKNHLEKGEEPETGTKIYLRKDKPDNEE